MTLLHKLKGTGGALLALALLPGTAHAGNLLSTAFTTYGIGSLSSLTGALTYTTVGVERTTAEQSFADLYSINLTGSPFSATTVGTTGNPLDPTTDVFNTVLYLFDSTGKGVLTNDDDPAAASSFSSSYRSTLSSSSLAPGLYYLGISTFGYEPQSLSGAMGATPQLIFPSQTDPAVDQTGTYGPAGPGGGLALSTWLATSNDVEAGTYSIALTGASYAAIPEPSSVALLAVGGCLLVGVGLRRRRTASA